MKTHRLKSLPALLLVVSLAGFSSAEHCWSAEAERMRLIVPDERPPDIFIDAYATPPEKFAAQELRSYLEKLTGRALSIRTDYWLKTAPAGKYIVVGQCRFAADIDASRLNTEQFVIDVAPERVAIDGGRDRQRGVLYGVYEFLERVGVHWYRPEPWGEYVPKLDSIELLVGRQIAPEPDYSYRSGLGGGFTRHAECTLDQSEWGSLWSLRNRLNGSDPGSDPRFGGQVSLRFDHIYYQLIPVEKYFDKHPDYFCLYNGQRRRTQSDSGATRPDNPTGLQLCLSNRGLQELFAQKIIAQAQGRSDLSTVSFSVTPNDACPFCECEECKAMDDPRDATSMSNRVCKFTNIIARQLAKEVPGARLSLNAYSTWTSPPTIVKRMEPNVLIHVALINGWAEYTKNFDAPEPNWNRATMDSFRRWKELDVSGIYAYEYYSGYGWKGPLPVVRTMADRVRKYRQFNVRGIYNETSPSWGPQGLEMYLFPKLIWNPDLDVERELNLYYRNFYGPAEKAMKAYHEALMQALEQSPQPVFSGGRGMHLVFKPKLVQELGALVDEAQRQVRGQGLFERRLKGVAAGHEFAARTCDILRLKKRDGTITPIAGKRGTFLYSPKAEASFQDLLSFVHGTAGNDAIFDVQSQPPYFSYVDNDVLRNAAFEYLREEDFLADF
jgi:hypothetical protein